MAVLAFLHVNANERTEVHRIIAQTLKPGGLLLLEGFAPDHIGYGRGGPKVPDMMFTEDRLRGDFEDLLDIEVLDVLKSELPQVNGMAVRLWWHGCAGGGKRHEQLTPV